MQAGDVVRLKSGGPLMTIIRQGDNGSWICTWWGTKEEEFASQAFAEIILEPYKG